MSNKYGTEHHRLRRLYAQHIATDGMLLCYRCHRPIYLSMADAPQGHVPNCKSVTCTGECWTHWDLGHTEDGTTWHGPEHACCNRQAGGRNGARKTNAARAHEHQMIVREW